MELTAEQRAEVLERVADGFESGRYQWGQGILFDGERYCVIGAINHELGATNEDLLGTDDDALDRHLYNSGAAVFGEVDPFEVYMFNDMFQRSGEDVIQLCRNGPRTCVTEGKMISHGC